MDAEEFKDRTKKFALSIVHLTEALPKCRTADVLGRQLLRSGTSVGANYRAACRAKSPADFISKLGTVEEECNETIFWMELILDSDLLEAPRICPLIAEANEILCMSVASIKTARYRKQTAARQISE